LNFPAKKGSQNLKSLNDEDFFERVWAVVRLVPAGRVTTYGAVARFAGAPGAARTVGWAMNASHRSDVHVPAHRVVNRIGMLTGKHHFRHPEMMKELLESEGVRIEDDRVTDFKKLFWDPYKELF
jgi:methylated-DNA-protein-cysteine methyltransferase related protein